MLKLDNVSKIYYNKGIIATGFNKVNLELKIGEFVAITGESGSGKSTLLNVISGLDSYEEGEMYINESETSHFTERDFEEYRRKYIANIFQNFNLVNSYTVYQNVELVLLLNGYKKKDVKKKILDIIDKVGLTQFKNTKVSKLSGGQKQRVAIARAIVKDTPIIVADEPTGNLDTESAKEVIEILKNVANDKLVVIVTHNIEQIEQYVTRIIKMHDGRIIEDIKKCEIQERSKVQESKYNRITIVNKYRLGIRNTFNIVSKFLLLFAVFFFVSASLLAEYASFQLSEYEATKGGMSSAFSDLSENRIIIKKKDKTSFTVEDYENIKNLSNIEKIVENDLFADVTIGLNRNEIFISSHLSDINTFDGKIDLGRLPQNEKEAVLEISKLHYYVERIPEEILEKTFSVSGFNGNDELMQLSIVGIKYSKDDEDYNAKIYIPKTVIDDLQSFVNRNFGNVTIMLNNKIQREYYIVPSKTVERGTAVVDDNLRYIYDNGNIKNKPIDITVENIYYTEALNLKIANVFTKGSFKKLTGYEKYDFYRNAIFISYDDYNYLYDKPSYQSSVYVKDMDLIDETMQELINLGLKPKKVTDYKVDGTAIYKQIIKIIKVVVTIFLIIVLFFISYIIIKIILKSRNVYFTTLRMLGATYKSVRRILDIELFINSTLSYLAVLGFIFLAYNNIINASGIQQLASYLTIREYVVIYLIIAVMSRIISRRFSKKLFKDTAINTYNEEV